MRRPSPLSLRWQAVWLLLGCLLPGLLALTAHAQSPTPGGDTGRQVKAAYLHKFIGFVEWPAGSFADPASPIVIGVIGDDKLADSLQALVAQRSVGGRPLQVRKLQPGDAPGGLQVLFIGQQLGERAALAELLAGLKGRPVLTVTDSDEAYARGCMINFVLLGERLRFEVALAPAEASGLRISALMLAAAYRVAKEAP